MRQTQYPGHHLVVLIQAHVHALGGGVRKQRTGLLHGLRVADIDKQDMAAGKADIAGAEHGVHRAHLAARRSQRIQAAAHGAFQRADVKNQPAGLELGQAQQNLVAGAQGHGHHHQVVIANVWFPVIHAAEFTRLG